MVAEGIHDMVPGEELHPVLEKIIDQYISEQANNEVITIAINAVREICARQPSAITED